MSASIKQVNDDFEVWQDRVFIATCGSKEKADNLVKKLDDFDVMANGIEETCDVLANIGEKFGMLALSLRATKR